jgi:hypothetical protein
MPRSLADDAAAGRDGMELECAGGIDDRRLEPGVVMNMDCHHPFIQRATG